jgi:hypothetical protein
MKRAVISGILVLAITACDPFSRMNYIYAFGVPVIKIVLPPTAKLGEHVEIQIESASICVGESNPAKDSFDQIQTPRNMPNTYSVSASRYNVTKQEYLSCDRFVGSAVSTRDLVINATGTFEVRADNTSLLDNEFRAYENRGSIPSIASASIMISE